MEKTMTNSSAKTLMLLSLWDMGGLETAVARSKIVDRVKKKGEKTADYTGMVIDLERTGAISISTKGGSIKLTQDGLQALGTALQDKALRFTGTIVRAKTANALLRWIAEAKQTIATPASNRNGVNNGETQKITSYEAFKVAALEVFEELNRDFNLDNLVPIYRIRRAIGDCITRSQFNDWLLKMQSDDFFQLLEGTVEDSAPDKIEDSVTNQIGKLRCYAQKLM